MGEGSSISLKVYLDEIKKYPIYSVEEQKELARQYHMGDKDARDKLIKSNFRFVVAVAKTFEQRLKYLDLLDIIQEGNMGLMRALETYNPETGAFTTYAYPWIFQKINRALMEKDSTIRLSVNIQNKKNKYLNIIDECKKSGRKLPSDKKMCELLDITMPTLKMIKESMLLNPTSLNKKISDKDDNEVGDFIDYTEDGYQLIEDSIDQKILLLSLKEILKPADYYILYYNILSDNKKILREIGSVFNVSRERVRQIVNKTLKQAKNVLDNPKKYYGILKRKYGNNLNKLNVLPIDPNKIIEFLYIKDNLDLREQKLYYMVFIDKINISREEICLNLDCNIEELNDMLNNLNEIRKSILYNESKFQSFRNNIIKTNGTSIYNLLKEEYKPINFIYLKSKYSNKSSSEFIDEFNEEITNLTINEQNLLDRYFKEPTQVRIKKSVVEKYVNLALFNYEPINVELPKKILYDTLKQYSNEFSEEQFLYLECFYFNNVKKEVFEKTYPNRKRSIIRHILVEKLERLYFNVNKILENNFNKEKYLKVRKYLKDYQKKYLDLFYGVNFSPISPKEISELFNMEYTKMHGIIRSARETAINIYCNNGLKKFVDKDIYIPYITNKVYEFTDETRKILSMYLIENKNYKTISDLTGLNTTRVSNIVTEALRKVDFYRFNIIKVNNISEEVLDDCFNYLGDELTDLEKQIIKLKSIDYKNYDEISEIMNVPKEQVKLIFRRFSILYNHYLSKDVELLEEDILFELEKHFTESVIKEEEKEIFALYNGIQCKYNKGGIKLPVEEIAKLKNKTKNVIYKTCYKCEERIKLFKIGKLNAENVYYSRGELIELLKDPFLPISDKERVIICSLFEINGYAYKSFKDLSKIYQENVNSLQRRYYRAIVNIKRYKNNEIEGTITYEGIKPYLKYFSNSDKVFINDFYKDSLSCEKIAKKHNITVYQVREIFNRIKVFLYEIINGEMVKKIDFEYFENAIKDARLPFYGDLDLATKIFDKLFGQTEIMRKPLSEIKEELNVNIETTSLGRLVYNLIVSVEKLRMGIEIDEKYSYSQVLDYYNKNRGNLSNTQLKSYQLYFEKMGNEKYMYSKYRRPTNDIIYDLIRDNNSNYFTIKNATREDIIKLLKRRDIKLTKNIKDQLMWIFNIYERELMSGKDLVHVYRIFDKLEKIKDQKKERTIINN